MWGACVACYAAQVLLCAICAAAGYWLYIHGERNWAGWSLFVLLLTMVLWNCRYTLDK